MCDGVLWVELEGAFEFLFAGGVVPLAPDQSKSERTMSFGERVVEFDGFAISRNGAFVSLVFGMRANSRRRRQVSARPT